MKKIVFAPIILCVLIAKAEESLYFPILDWWTGYHGNVDWGLERERISNLGLTAVMGGGNKSGEKYGDDTMMVRVCDPTGIRMFIGSDPTIEGAPPNVTYFADADHIIGRFHALNHDWDAALWPGYPSTRIRLHRIADSMTCHKGGILGNIPLKDHNMGYYLVCAEGPEAYCVQCYEAIEQLCSWIKQNDTDPNHKTWAWINNLWLKDGDDWKVKDALWDICEHLDVICFSCYKTPSVPPEDAEGVQKTLDTLIMWMDTATKRMRENEERTGKKFEWHANVADWRFVRVTRRKFRKNINGNPDDDLIWQDTVYSSRTRRKTEQEMRCMVSIALSRGAKGIRWETYGSTDHSLPPEPPKPPHPDEIGKVKMTYKRREIYNGLVDYPNRIPFDESNPDYMTWDSTAKNAYPYTWVKNINRDLRNLGPAFKAIEWDTARSVNSSQPRIKGVPLLKYVDDIKWDMPPSTSPKYVELGLFNGNVQDPAPGSTDSLKRNYINVVNRHTLPQDSVKLSIYLKKSLFPFTPKWVIDMRRYKYSSLDENDNDWIINHNGWTWYLDVRDWKPLPAIQPGEGRLYAVVDDDYLWDI